jgi:hypothetical protein
MPFCPNCGAEYREEYTRCADCDVELVVALLAEEAQPGETGPLELVPLASFLTVAEAGMIKELLEDNGILVALRGQSDPLGVVSGAVRTELLVEAPNLERAVELYEAFYGGESDEEETTDFTDSTDSEPRIEG